MADTAKFVIKLKDQVSKPAKEASQSVDEFKKKAEGTDPPVKKLAKSGGSLGFMFGGLAAGALAAAGATALVANRAIKTERAVNTLQRLTGGRGREAFEEISGLANQLGLDVDDTNDAYAGFLKQKFKPEAAKDLIKLGADLQALGGTAEDTAGVFLALRQIKAVGRLQGDELNQLAERGVAVALVYEEIGRAMGVSAEEAAKLKEQGKVTADVAIEAIKRATNRSLNQSGLGESARDFVQNTMDGAIKGMRSRATSFWIQLSDQAAPGLSKGLRGVLGVVDDFSKSKAGANVVAFLGESMQKLGGFLEQALPLIAETGTALLSGFVEGFQAADDASAQLFGPNGIAGAEEWAGFIRNELIPGVSAFGRGLGEVASIAADVGRVIGMVMTGVGRVMSMLTVQMEQSGSMAMQGFLEGVKSIPVVGQMVSLAQQIHGAFSGPKGIDEGSPSKLFEESGEMSGAGYARGVAKSMPTGSDFAPSLNNRAIMAGASRLGSQGLSGGGVNVGGITIQVSGAGNPEEVASATMAEFEANMGRVLSKFAGEAAV